MCDSQPRLAVFRTKNMSSEIELITQSAKMKNEWIRIILSDIIKEEFTSKETFLTMLDILRQSTADKLPSFSKWIDTINENTINNIEHHIFRMNALRDSLEDHESLLKWSENIQNNPRLSKKEQTEKFEIIVDQDDCIKQIRLKFMFIEIRENLIKLDNLNKAGWGGNIIEAYDEYKKFKIIVEQKIKEYRNLKKELYPLCVCRINQINIDHPDFT